MTCNYCQVQDDHVEKNCPLKAARKDGSDVAILAQQQKNGSVCNICKIANGHLEKHHMEALTDMVAAAKASGSQSAKAKSKADGKGNGKKADGKAEEKCPEGQEKCKWGLKCYQIWDFTQPNAPTCTRWHPKSELKVARDALKAKKLADKSDGGAGAGDGSESKKKRKGKGKHKG